MKTAGLYINVMTITLVLVMGLISGCSNVSTGPGPDKLVFQDDFKDARSGWFVYKADETKGGKYETEAYSVWTNTHSTIIALNPKTRQNLGDFAAEVDVKKTSGGRGTALGIIYRLDNRGTHYRFTISDNQTFWIGRNTGAMEEQIQDEQFSEYIKPATESNRLKVVCIGKQHEVYVNNNKLATISDNASIKGEMGMAFTNFGTPDASYTFSNFKLWTR